MKSRVMCVSVLLIFLFSVSIVSAISEQKFSKSKNGVMFQSDIDTSKVTIEKLDKEIKIRSSEHKETMVKIKKSDIEALGDFTGKIRVTHFTDSGIQDWSIVLEPKDNNGYFEIPVEFSSVTIEVEKTRLANWDMELWTGSVINSWTVSGACDRSTAHMTGSYSARVSGTPGYLEQNNIAVTGGLPISINVYAYTDSSGSAQVVFYNAGGTEVGSILKSTTTTGTWENLVITTTVPATATKMMVRLINWNAGYTRFDTVLITQPVSVTATETIGNGWANTSFSYNQVSGYTALVYEFDGIDFNHHGKLATPIITIDGTPTALYYRQGNRFIIFPSWSDGAHTVAISQQYNLPPTLLTPSDGSTWTFDYPPMYDDVTFTWEDTSTTCQIQIAEDSAFSNVVYTHETTEDTATCSLPAGTYYWRVRSYDPIDGAYGEYPDEFSVIVVSSSGTITGTGIMGTVYYSAELGNYQYIPGAVVTVYNETYTTQKTTGSVGYYQVLGLTNGTYYVSVEVDGYDSTPAYAVNVTSGKVSIQDVAMQKEQSYFAPHYVKILIKEKSIFGLIKTPVSDATVTVYENSNTNMLTSQKTGSDGAVGFELSENVRYRVVVEKDSITQTEYLTPTSSTYEIVLGEDSESVLPESQFYEVCNISVDKTAINSSTARIDISYNDSSENTNLVYFTVSRPAGNGTLTLLNTSGSYTENCTTSFYVDNFKGETFTVKAFIDHSLFGNVDKTFAVSFSGSNLPFAGKSMAILAIIVLFFVGSMFGRGDIGYAGIIVCGLGYFFWYMDIFESLGSAINSTIWVGLVFALVFSIILIFNEKRTEGGI